MNIDKNQTISLSEIITNMDQSSTIDEDYDSTRTCDKKIIACVSYILSCICERNSLAQTSSQMFDHKIGSHLTITIEKYLIERITKYIFIPIDYFAIALVLIDKIRNNDHNVCITERNVHRLIAIAITETIKFNDDKSFKNSYYAKVAGLSIEEFNKLELLFLKLLDFDVWVHEDVILEYKKHLLAIARRR